LDGPPLPRQVEYLWLRFWSIHTGRAVNGMAPNKASQLDIWAWQQNRRVTLEPWEVEAIDRLGSLWVRAQIENRPKPTTPPPDGRR